MTILAPGERLASHRDPTADAAVGATDESPPSLQCTTCHAIGSALDESVWPELAGVRCHVVGRIVPDEDMALFGVEGWREHRRLCGPARLLKSA